MTQHDALSNGLRLMWLRRAAWWTLKVLSMPFVIVLIILEELAERTGA